MSKFALKTTLPGYLQKEQIRIEAIAKEYGLDFFPTIFEMLSYDQMNEVAAYSGFPNRYPHWRFGMEYEQLSKNYEYGLSKIYEMVINNNPSFAYLLEGNSLTEQRLVMAHVYGHVDFFKNNFSFRATDLDAQGNLADPMRRIEPFNPQRKWVDKMANHGQRVRRAMDRLGVNKVEEFVDLCLSLENLIDPWRPFSPPRPRDSETEPVEVPPEVPRLRSDRSYMDKFINPDEYIEEQRKKIQAEAEKPRRFPESPQRDVLAFLLEHAPMERWERDILDVIREEAYYFTPQIQTKISNEGWACLDARTMVFTNHGAISMKNLVDGAANQIFDGETLRSVDDRNIIRDHATVSIKTRRGFTLTGSNNHRVMSADGQWIRLDELSLGSELRLSGAQGLWAEQEVSVSWISRRKGSKLSLPMTRDLAILLGLFLGGSCQIGVNNDLELIFNEKILANSVAELTQRYFDATCSIQPEEGAFRVRIDSEMLYDFLSDGLRLRDELGAFVARIPEVLLRSPVEVLQGYLQACFDCLGSIDSQGIFWETPSEELAYQTQLLLLNLGALSQRTISNDGYQQIRIHRNSAAVFAKKIQFNLAQKKVGLIDYLRSSSPSEAEPWVDSVVEIQQGRGDVYDISVGETHRYAAGGFINHNSYWHSKMMTEKIADANDIIEYADRNAGVLATSGGRLNPYKLGVEILRSIEERWDRGQFGRDWEECNDYDEKNHWDLRLGLGRQKLFEVRRLYNDITLIDEFLTIDLARELKLYTFSFSHRNDRFEIETREFKKVKDKLLSQLTNAGNPVIVVLDANFENKGELLLRHEHSGVDLRLDYAKEVLRALHRIWRRPVAVATIVEQKPTLLRYDGSEHTSRPYKA